MDLRSTYRRLVPAAVRRRVSPRARRLWSRLRGASPIDKTPTNDAPSVRDEAREAARRHDWAHAAERWHAVLAGRATGPAEAYVGLATAQRNLGRLATAEETAQRGMRAHPTNPKVASEHAEIASARGDWMEAVARWTSVVEGFERVPTRAFLRLIAAQRRLGMFEDAEVVASRAVREHPESKQVARSHAEVASDRGEWEEAHARWSRAKHLHGERVPPLVYVRLIAALRQLGDLDGAEATAWEGMSAHPENSRVASQFADVAMDRWEWDEAAARWDLVIELAGDRARPQWHYRRGLALERTWRYRDAAAAHERALELLEDVDEGWAHAAVVEWGFRRDYARRQAGLDAPSDPRLDCRVSDGDANGAPASPPGVFEVDVAHMGLAVRGYLHAVDVETVDIEVHGIHFKSVGVDAEHAPVGFRFVIKHEALATFPQRCQLRVRSAAGSLITRGGSPTVDLKIPYGDGSFADLVADGSVVTKKGQIVDPSGSAAADGSGMLWSPVGAKDRALAAYEELAWFFEREFDVELFLLYGTLLGYYRDGDFIAEDDDMDVGFVARAEDPLSLKAEATEVVERLLRHGFDVSTRRQGTLLKVFVDGVDFDVFPVWFFRDRAWAHDAIKAERSDFLPARRAEFLGRQVYVPNDPEVFLRGTYGPSWTVPDPSFRYYLSAEVRRVIGLTNLTPSEARDLRERNLRERGQDPGVGRFTIAGALERGYLPDHRP